MRNSRSKKSLPWPTKDQIQGQIRAKTGENFVPDIFPGEVLTYVLSHRATGYFLGRRKKIPFTLDQSIDLMASNVGLQETLRAGGGAAHSA